MSTLVVLAVIVANLSAGLQGTVSDSVECAEALRLLTAKKAAITDVRVASFNSALDPTAQRVISRSVGSALVYTIEGPQDEVAIIACAPAIAQK